MDTQRLDKAHPRVTFDILREWNSRCFSRRSSRCPADDAKDTPTSGGPWRALVLALRYAELESWLPEDGDKISAASASPSPEEILQRERELRRILVAVYRKQTREAIDDILAAKLKEPDSYFSLVGYTLEESRGHWTWYLYCLTFAEGEELKSGDTVRMPLDLVDVQAVALGLHAQVTVTRMMTEAERFRPPAGSPPARYAAHLVAHEGRWSALLGPRAPEEEVLKLWGSVVQLGDFPPGPLHSATRQACTVLNYDKECEAYVVVGGQKKLLVDRSKIAQVVFHPKGGKEEINIDAGAASSGRRKSRKGQPTENEAYPPGAAPPFRGIPDAAVEFQVLHEIVRMVARQRLHTMKMELSGRAQDGAPTDNGVGERPLRPLNPLPRYQPQVAPNDRPQLHGAQANEPVAPSPDRQEGEGPGHRLDSSKDNPEIRREEVPVIQRELLKRVLQQLAEGFEVTIIAPCPCRQDAGDPRELKFAVGDELGLRQFSEPWIFARNTTSGKTGWCPVERLSVWRVMSPFLVQKSWSSAESYLGLQTDDLVSVLNRYDKEWEGWAFGTRWGVEEREGVKHEGVFPLSLVEPIMLVKRSNPS